LPKWIFSNSNLLADFVTETLRQCSDSVNLVAVYRSNCRSYFIVDNSDRRSGFSCQNPSGGEVPVCYPYTCILVQTLVTRHPHRIRLSDPTDMIRRFMYPVFSWWFPGCLDELGLVWYHFCIANISSCSQSCSEVTCINIDMYMI
jgi:hypothetical protein